MVDFEAAQDALEHKLGYKFEADPEPKRTKLQGAGDR
jgi:hypothetical protein